MIKGGYVLQARKIESSDISHRSPHIREIFNWLYRNANFKDLDKLSRGQLVCTYKDIQEGLSWYIGYRKEMYSKGQCETAMKALRKATMITTTRTTRGIIVTICNYDFYQNPNNYENYTRTTTKPTRELHDPLHDTEESKNDKKDKNKYSDDSEEIRLTQLLYDLCKKDDSKFKEPNIQKWAEHIDKLMRLDKRTPIEVETVMRWAKNDEFWSSNILSTSKLRKQFPQLTAKMVVKKSGTSRSFEREEFNYPEGEVISNENM